MPQSLAVRLLSPPEAEAAVPQLARILVDCVAGGASVGFMNPLTQDRAERFWAGVAAGVAAGQRLLLAAAPAGGGPPIGTVQVVLSQPENQPHRGDISKMLVMRAARGRGAGQALMRAAERAALAHGKTLLVLDTASDAAERLYAREGWVRVGAVPDFALLPEGPPCETVFYYKRLAPTPAWRGLAG
ncbi:GNAT family N-acetyltransferase [Stella sp.]|uniref:GNAT family N-acetyltransferase n=1 Tax=Stella sp. TaxID=2912054 RepID=UPI0035B02DD9